MSAYDQFDSLLAAKAAYRRARSRKFFILNGDENPPCAGCGRPLRDFSGEDAEGKPMHPPGYQGNRCTYDPRTGEISPLHYLCAWGKTLGALTSLRAAS